jgi:hypothetical protein
MPTSNSGKWASPHWETSEKSDRPFWWIGWANSAIGWWTLPTGRTIPPSPPIPHQIHIHGTNLVADTRDREQLKRHLLAQSQEVGRQLRRQGFLARTITLKLKDTDFRQITRSVTLDRPSQSSETIYRTAEALLARQSLDKAIRLIGVGASALIADTTPQQACLFPSIDQKESGWEKVTGPWTRLPNGSAIRPFTGVFDATGGLVMD